MAKVLVSVKLEMDDQGGGGEPGVPRRAIARYLVVDADEPAFRKTGTKELGAADFGRAAADLYSEAVAAIRTEEGIA